VVTQEVTRIRHDPINRCKRSRTHNLLVALPYHVTIYYAFLFRKCPTFKQNTYPTGGSWDNGFGITIVYELEGREVGVRVLIVAGDFYPLQVVQTCSAAHPTSYIMDTMGSIPLASAVVHNILICTSTPPIYLHGVMLN
jgi:hypothetical protein